MAANPYVQGWREWDERYADLVFGKRSWQIAAGLFAPDQSRPRSRHRLARTPQPLCPIRRRHRSTRTGDHNSEAADARVDAGRRSQDGALGNRSLYPRRALGLKRSGR